MSNPIIQIQNSTNRRSLDKNCCYYLLQYVIGYFSPHMSYCRALPWIEYLSRMVWGGMGEAFASPKSLQILFSCAILNQPASCTLTIL